MLTASRSNRRPTSSRSSSIDSSLKLIDELTPGRTFVGLREGPKTPAAGQGDGTRPCAPDESHAHPFAPRNGERLLATGSAIQVTPHMQSGRSGDRGS